MFLNHNTHTHTYGVSHVILSKAAPCSVKTWPDMRRAPAIQVAKATVHSAVNTRRAPLPIVSDLNTLRLCTAKTLDLASPLVQLRQLLNTGSETVHKVTDLDFRRKKKLKLLYGCFIFFKNLEGSVRAS